MGVSLRDNMVGRFCTVHRPHIGLALIPDGASFRDADIRCANRHGQSRCLGRAPSRTVAPGSFPHDCPWIEARHGPTDR